MGSDAADNEDIFVCSDRRTPRTARSCTTPGDGGSARGSSTWSSNNLNALFQFSNGNLVMSFGVATTIGGVTYQPYEMVLYTVAGNSFQRARQRDVVLGRHRRCGRTGQRQRRLLHGGGHRPRRHDLRGQRPHPLERRLVVSASTSTAATTA